MRQVIDLYVGRQIEKLIDAKHAIIKLSSKGKKPNIVGLERVAKSKEALPATGKLTRITSKRPENKTFLFKARTIYKKHIENKGKELQQFIIRYT